MRFRDEVIAALPSLRRYAHALLRDRDGADDLVQDCLERALSRRTQWRRDGSLKPWLFRILLNRFRDDYRKRTGHPVLVPIDGLAGPSRSGGQEASLDLREVHDAMGRLPEDQRAALLLVCLEGFSLSEAAELLGIPEGTLASRLARGRTTLRAMTGRDRPGMHEVKGDRP